MREGVWKHPQTGANKNKNPRWKRSQATQGGDKGAGEHVAGERAGGWFLIFQGLMSLDLGGLIRWGGTWASDGAGIQPYPNL